VQEENQTTAVSNETNETVPTENASGLLSAALQAKLAEAKNETVQEESTKERFVSNLGSLGGAFSTITAFLTATTYFIPNWLFIVLVIVIVAFANYLLRRKDLVNKFNKFLDEDTEAPKEEKKNGKPSAQDILDAEEKKKNSKKK
jgi:magnesium-transporting ATPase (P-type)